MMAYNSPWWTPTSQPNETSDLGNDLDIAVQNAAKAGMYIIIDDHSYCCGGKMPINDPATYEHGKEFWNYVAPRYAAYRHVIYEIKNEPPDNVIAQSGFVNHTKELYKIIRSHAPNNLVIVFTPGANNEAEMPDDRDYGSSSTDLGGLTLVTSGADALPPFQLNGGKTLVAWHAYEQTSQGDGKGSFGRHVDAIRKRAAVIADEFGNDNNATGYKIAKNCEAAGISWVWLMENGTDFDIARKLRTGYDYENPDYQPTWPRDPGAIDMAQGPSGPTGTADKLHALGHGQPLPSTMIMPFSQIQSNVANGTMHADEYQFFTISGERIAASAFAGSGAHTSGHFNPIIMVKKQ
jgi:hypothetical protein